MPLFSVEITSVDFHHFQECFWVIHNLVSKGNLNDVFFSSIGTVDCEDLA